MEGRPSRGPAQPGGARGAVIVAAVAAVVLATLMSAPARSVSAATSVSLATAMSSPAGLMYAGPRGNGTGVLPDGRIVTPVGRQVEVGLQPINSLLTRDGKRLVTVDSGFDDDPLQPQQNGTRRYLDVVDTATMTATPFQDTAASYGLAETADGTLLVAEGQTDSIGLFAPAVTSTGAPTYTRTATIALDPSKPDDYPWGIALSPDGSRLYVAGFSANSLITVDMHTRTVVARAQTGAYPYGVVVSRAGAGSKAPDRVYVTNWGLYNQDADPTLESIPPASHPPIDVPPATIGGYNTDQSSSVWTYSVAGGAAPSVVAKTRIGRDLNGDTVVGGSLPSALALSPDQGTLAVTSSNDDLIQLLDVTTTAPSAAQPALSEQVPTGMAHPLRTVDMHVIDGGPTGAQPDALAWTSDGTALLVAEGGRNTVAVVDPSKVGTDPLTVVGAAAPNRAAVTGRIPTGWYPSALALSPDDSRLFVTNLQGLGSGPNGNQPARSYDPNTLNGSVQLVDVGSACGSIVSLASLSDEDNGLTPVSTGPGTALGDGSVVPTTFGSPPSSKIKHVFIIIKENRTFDQELGDVPGVERDQSLVTFGQNITPNLHQLATRFATVNDNFYANSEVSIDGHFSVDTGQVNEFLQKVTSSNYAGKFPYGAWDTLVENLPQGGFIWNNAARNKVTTRVYGEGTYVVGVAPELLAAGDTTDPTGKASPALFAGGVQYDPRYPSQVNIQGSDPTGTLETLSPYNDENRADVFAQDMEAFTAASANGTADPLPQLNVMILFDDHGNGAIAGAPTPERETAENDHALGRVISSLSRTPFWKDSAVFITEDDTQGGQDHVDAHRTIGLAVSPWVKKGYVSNQHMSFSSIQKTADLILGLPPTSLQEMTASSMADDFISASQQPDLSPYTTIPNPTVPETNHSVATALNADERAAAQLALSIPPGIDNGGSALPADERLLRQGELQAGDPNVVTEPAVTEHTLPTTSPAAAPSLPSAPPGTAGSPISGCLAAGSVVVGEAPSTGALLAVGAIAAAAIGGHRLRRRRPARGRPRT